MIRVRILTLGTNSLIPYVGALLLQRTTVVAQGWLRITPSACKHTQIVPHCFFYLEKRD
jgi:hypothetical protein